MNEDSDSKFRLILTLILTLIWFGLFIGGGSLSSDPSANVEIIVGGSIGIFTWFFFIFIFANLPKLGAAITFFLAALSVALVKIFKFYDFGFAAVTFGYFLPALTAGLLVFAFSEDSTESTTNIPKTLTDNNEVDAVIPEIVRSLISNPEQSKAELRIKFPDVSKPSIYLSIVSAFKELLNTKQYQKASALLDYHPVDEYSLLPVMEHIDFYSRNGALDLKPHTFKIILEKGETAYEKLPCNWQNIHTYLAPLEDGIDQSDILDTGNIYITDQRVFFVGEKGSETVRLSDVAHIDLKEDALQFFRDEGLSEIFAFPTAHHAVYAELVIKELMGRG